MAQTLCIVLNLQVYNLARDKQWGSKYSVRIGNAREIEVGISYA